MTSGEIAQRLAGRIEEDLALFERFHALCEEELAWLERPDLEGLETLLEGKEALMKEIEERAEKSAPLWTRFAEEAGEGGEDSLIDRMEENAGRIRTLIERIQGVESAAAERMAKRKQETKDALGSLGRGGRALSAYRRVRIFSPRFLDKRE